MEVVVVVVVVVGVVGIDMLEYDDDTNSGCCDCWKSPVDSDLIVMGVSEAATVVPTVVPVDAVVVVEGGIGWDVYNRGFFRSRPVDNQPVFSGGRKCGKYR